MRTATRVLLTAGPVAVELARRNLPHRDHDTMSVSVFAHPFLGALLGDAEVAACFSAEADIAAMLRFEAALAQAEAEAGVIPDAAAEAIVAAVSRMHIVPTDLAGAVARDGVVVPELVRLLRAAVGAPHAGLAHKGSTSQDVIDTSLFLRLKAAADILDARLGALMAAFDRLEAEAGAHMLCGHTRMQRARPVSLAHKVAGWRDPLARHRARLPDVAQNLFRVQLGGAGALVLVHQGLVEPALLGGSEPRQGNEDFRRHRIVLLRHG